ncbi:MAG: amidohydrolase family protein [Rhodospirillaceae bacterium]|jgi:N-acyl-D-aspartate/D-glutamate deacylase|nr:amidohydrolase family protein [Rhodospirillaceae bacterium]MBT5458148.1 amidohydrolase family protein [Rhodospirillaceae bacterium]
MTYDLKITGGTIVDGTGESGYGGDVGIKDGKIVALGDAPDDADRTIDADGKIVCPGFIDIHTHYDAQIIWDRMLTVSPWHGVTTVVIGNCGFGVAPTRPENRDLIVRTLEKVEGMSKAALETGMGDWGFETFPQYLDAIEANGTAINVAAYIGHTPLRLYVMGEDAYEREATEEEIEQMRAIVREAMEAGALGFATSESPNHVGAEGRPVPSRFASFEEMRSLASALRDAGTGIVQISAGGEIKFDHYVTLAETTGQNLNWSSLLTRNTHPGLHRDYMNKTTELIEGGKPIYPQMSCRELTMEFRFDEPFPMERLTLFEPLGKMDLDGKRQSYNDPSFREALRVEMSGQGSDAGPIVRLREAWNNTAVSECPTDPSLEDRTLSDIARERGVDPVDVALDLSLESDFETRFRIPLANNDEKAVAELLGHKDTLLGLSDAGAHTSQLCDACFATHLLGHWVRDKGVLPVEEAVRKLTSLPADVFGLTGRGRLAVGGPADVVIFDPDTIAAGKLRRVTDLPGGEERLVSESTGIEAVIVNGAMLRNADGDVLSDDAPLPGALLRNGAAREWSKAV